MRFTLIKLMLALVAPASVYSGAAHAANGESAYITQIPAGSQVLALPAQVVRQGPIQGAPAMVAVAQPVGPQQALNAGRGGNLAQTLQVGSYNQVAQIQAGANNVSTVGVIGARNSVGVLQAGNNLRSNLVLAGTQGLNVGVIQPNGSMPINMLIARLPNGGLMIKR